ncbi:MAG TPA: hypothetical protein VK437_01810 [Steroidobacteraceae bacterium]|nr:hypothetical protein [Steroidobacteraceae bacterium]
MSELVISIAVNVVLGGVLAVLLWRKRAGDPVRLKGAAEAVDTFRRYFPDAAGTATLSADRRAALIDLGGTIGILERRGRRWNARILVPSELSRVQSERDGTITLVFADFGWPRARFRIEEADARAQWLGRLQSLTTAASSDRYSDLRHA